MAVFNKRQGNVQDGIGEVIRRVNDNSKRLRLVEQKGLNLESTISGLDKSILEQVKQAKTAIEKLGLKIDELGNRVAKLEDDNRKIIKQLERVATKTELKEIQGFIDLINPIKSEFVTKSEVRKMFEESKK